MLLKQKTKENMPKTYLDNQVLKQFILRMDKNDTSFFYFTMESNENVCFYSTLNFEKGQKFRDIIIHVTPELEEHFLGVLQHQKKKRSIEILDESYTTDA